MADEPPFDSGDDIWRRWWRDSRGQNADRRRLVPLWVLAVAAATLGLWLWWVILT